MPRLNASLPIVREDRTMELPFWAFMIEVDKQIPIVGTGSPEGAVTAPYLSQYLDPTGTAGLVAYRKMLPDIGGDKSKGWVQLSVPDATFSSLDADGFVGTGAGQLAEGDHQHPASDIISGTLADARISESSVTQHEAALTLATSQTTSGTFADARISESSVTQHEAALTVAQSQVTGLTAALKYYPPTVADEATDPYTLVIGDANTVKRFTTASAAVTIPTNASVAFPTGTEISIRQAGTGTLVLTTTGLTINGTVPSWAQHVEVKFRKVATDTWDVV